MLTKEQSMLKNYLRDSNIDKKYAITPRLNHDLNLPRLAKITEENSISPGVTAAKGGKLPVYTLISEEMLQVSANLFTLLMSVGSF